MRITISNIKIEFIVNAVLPILIGIAIYIFFRELCFFNISHEYFPLYTGYEIPDWLIYNLPDGLWLYSLLYTLSFVWRDKVSKYYILWIFMAIVFTILTEILQEYNIISGTFDINDIIVYIITFILFCISNKKQIYKSLL